MLSAAGSLRWLHDTIAPAEAIADLVATADEVAPGSDDLLFLPYLTGERTPHPDPYARGAFVGLTIRHTRSHLVRAVLEGVAFGLRDALELVRGMGIEVTELRASGGGTRSPLWRQIMADVLEAELVTVATAEGAAYGAAVLAAVGAGWHPDVAAATDAWVTAADRVAPVQPGEYAGSYERYRRLYPALRPIFPRE
jgi:xylulokinase